MDAKCSCERPSRGYTPWDDDKADKNAHWGDFMVLKRCLVKRWEDITKMETCLHSLWSKRKNLEETLAESESQLAGIEVSLPSLSSAIEGLNREIEEEEARWADIHQELAGREGDVDTLLSAHRRSLSPSCPCRRFTASISSPLDRQSVPRKEIRSLMSSVGTLKSREEEIRRRVELLRVEVNCKITEQRNLEKRRVHLKTLVEEMTRNLLTVNEECETVNQRWKSYRCEVEKLQTQMKEQWGPSALDRLIPANVSRSRFF